MFCFCFSVSNNNKKYEVASCPTFNILEVDMVAMKMMCICVADVSISELVGMYVCSYGIL